MRKIRYNPAGKGLVGTGCGADGLKYHNSVPGQKAGWKKKDDRVSEFLSILHLGIPIWGSESGATDCLVICPVGDQYCHLRMPGPRMFMAAARV